MMTHDETPDDIFKISSLLFFNNANLENAVIFMAFSSLTTQKTNIQYYKHIKAYTMIIGLIKAVYFCCLERPFHITMLASYQMINMPQTTLLIQEEGSVTITQNVIFHSCSFYKIFYYIPVDCIAVNLVNKTNKQNKFDQDHHD